MRKFVIIISFLMFSFQLIYSQTTKFDSLKGLVNTTNVDEMAPLLYKIAMNANSRDSGIFYVKKALKSGLNYKNQKVIIDCYNILGNYYYNTRQLDSAIYILENQVNFLLLNDSTNIDKITSSYIKLGVNNRLLGNYSKSAEYYTKALSLAEKNKAYDAMASSKLNLGVIYMLYLNNDNSKTALQNFKQAIEYAQKAQNGQTYVRAKINVANVYEKRKMYDSTLIVNNQVIKFVEKNKKNLNGPQFLMFEAFLSNSSIYIEKKKYREAEKTLKEIEAELTDVLAVPSSRADIYFQYASLYSKWKKIGLAIEYYQKTIELYSQLDYKEALMKTVKQVSVLYAKQKQYSKSLEYFQKYSDIKDSLFNDETAKQINEMQAKYESEKKEQEIELLTKEQEKQKLVNQSLLAVGILVLIVAFLVFRSYLLKKKANAVLQKQNDEISRQKEQIEVQSEEIKDSIKYASRIQRAVLPPIEMYNDLFREYFILFRPRDIVSGDFYWMAEKDDIVYVAAADCTGHGVPGAFMSMLGISFLNEIVNKEDINTAADILNDLREHIMQALKQTGKANEAKDGMDIALSIIDRKHKKLQFAGAYNPLYLIRNGELIQYKANKMPIGIYFKKGVPFDNQELEIQENDILYMFSDGYMDQFGGEKGRKFMSKNFKKLLTSIADEPMQKQKDILDVRFDRWKAERPQIDDVLVLGIKI